MSYVHTFRLAFCPPPLTLSLSHTHTQAQMGEEVYAFENWFYGLENGTFLEIGALDGVRYSNTLALERVLGWKGVLIEASPTSFTKLKKNRPGQLHINAAVCARKQTVHFLEHPNSCCRGIAEFMDVRYRDGWYPSLSPHGGWHFTDPSKTIPIRQIDCLPLKQLIAPLWSNKTEKHESGRSRLFLPSIVNHSHHINFFSLDVEGGELAVLKSIDFSDVRFDVIVVEDLFDNVSGIERLLQSKGYVYHKRVERNKWFVRSDFKPTQMQQEITAHSSNKGSR